jgi:hypothetical protein
VSSPACVCRVCGARGWRPMAVGRQGIPAFGGKRLAGRDAPMRTPVRWGRSATQRTRRPAARRGAHSFPPNSSLPVRALVRGDV